MGRIYESDRLNLRLDLHAGCRVYLLRPLDKNVTVSDVRKGNENAQDCKDLMMILLFRFQILKHINNLEMLLRLTLHKL